MSSTERFSEDPFAAIEPAIADLLRDAGNVDLTPLLSKFHESSQAMAISTHALAMALLGIASDFNDTSKNKVTEGMGALFYALWKTYSEIPNAPGEVAERWLKAAVRLGHVNAVRDAWAEYLVDLDDIKELTTVFAGLMARLSQISSESHSRKMEQASKIFSVAALLIRKALALEPRLALDWLAQLMSRLNALSVDIAELNALRSEVQRMPMNSGMQVMILDHIGPSADRVVKQVCQQYEPLRDEPTAVKPVPNLALLRATLHQEFPWFAEITEWIIRQLCPRSAGTKGFRLPPLLLLGDPGLGKTAYVQRIAELSGLPFLVLPLAGKNDNRDVAGTARGWGTGHPSRILALINDHRIANPIIVADELDKAGGSDHNGRILDTLLELFEPASAVRHYDDYLWGHADLSRVTWICTANDVSHLPTTLLSRLTVKTVPYPKKAHYPAIVLRTIARYFDNEGLHPGWLPYLGETEWQWLERHYTSPRKARIATEHLISLLLTSPGHNAKCC